MKKVIALTCFSCMLLFWGCSDPVSSPPDIPIGILLSAADTLTLENQKIVMTTYMWRDFMPISPPGGKPLAAIIYIETIDKSTISPSITSDAIYIVKGNEVWKSNFSNEQLPSDVIIPFRIVKIARDGPKWGPGIYVDVVVRLKVNGASYLLKSSQQYIGRTD